MFLTEMVKIYSATTINHFGLRVPKGIYHVRLLRQSHVPTYLLLAIVCTAAA